MLHTRLIFALIAVVGALAVAGQTRADDAPVVYASNYPLFYFAQEIAGGELDIRLPALEGDPAELDAFLRAFEPGAFPWAVCCFGPAEAEAVRRAASLGGHVRIGFENNRLLPDGTVARNNAHLIASELALMRKTGASQRPLATADWVRRQLAGQR